MFSFWTLFTKWTSSFTAHYSEFRKILELRAFLHFLYQRTWWLLFNQAPSFCCYYYPRLQHIFISILTRITYNPYEDSEFRGWPWNPQRTSIYGARRRPTSPRSLPRRKLMLLVLPHPHCPGHDLPLVIRSLGARHRGYHWFYVPCIEWTASHFLPRQSWCAKFRSSGPSFWFEADLGHQAVTLAVRWTSGWKLGHMTGLLPLQTSSSATAALGPPYKATKHQYLFPWVQQ